ncbi:MAG: hypothetical protein AAF213_13850 [Pseudomonadota bacterium]
MLTTTYSEDQLRRRLYPALIDYHAARHYASLVKDEHYQGRRAWIRQTEQAAEGLIAVPLALGFSIIGALTHMAKVAGYLLALFLPRLLAVTIPSLVVIIAAGAMHFTPNTVTSTPSYSAFERSTDEAMGPVVRHGLRFVIHAEHRLFPLNNWIHKVILRDVDFAQF